VLCWLRRSGFSLNYTRPGYGADTLPSPPPRLGAAADIVKRYAAAVGLNAAEFAGHSLRSGLGTSAAMAGASERSMIMRQTGHRSEKMVRQRALRVAGPESQYGMVLPSHARTSAMASPSRRNGHVRRHALPLSPFELAEIQREGFHGANTSTHGVP